MTRPPLPDGMTVRALRGEALDAHLAALADLRITVFRGWPYLYNGTPAYERDYLQSYRDRPEALLLGAFDGDRLVGASTSTPMEDHAEAFSDAFSGLGLPLETILYGAESVVVQDYRGLGLGHRFFDLREDHARALGRSHVAFCSVMRTEDHPARPTTYHTNDTFWLGRGYAPLPGVVATFAWCDLCDQTETQKLLQFWIRAL